MTKRGAPEWYVTVAWFGRLTPQQTDVLVNLGFSVACESMSAKARRGGEGWYEFTRLTKADTANAALGRVFRWIWTVGVKSIRHEVASCYVETEEQFLRRNGIERIEIDEVMR